jgi:small subunit ribosomal protein S17
MSEQTENKTAERGNRKQRRGVVVKAAAQKTIVVEVRRRVRHPKYHKFISRKDKYAVHDLIGCEVGDRVLIRETRPLSKTKRWRVVQKLTKDA